MKNKLCGIFVYFVSVLLILFSINCIIVFLKGSWSSDNLYLILMSLVLGLGGIEGFKNAKEFWNKK